MFNVNKEFSVNIQNEKSIAKAAIKNKRLEIEYGGFTFNGQKWGSSIKDELRLNSSIKLLESGVIETINGFEPAPGVIIDLNLETALAASTFLMVHYNNCFNTERIKASEINKLKNIKTIKAYLDKNLNTGWPE